MRIVHIQNQPKEKKPSKKELAMADATFLASHLNRFAQKRTERKKGRMLELLSTLSEQEIESLTRLSTQN